MDTRASNADDICSQYRMPQSGKGILFAASRKIAFILHPGAGVRRPLGSIEECFVCTEHAMSMSSGRHLPSRALACAHLPAVACTLPGSWLPLAQSPPLSCVLSAGATPSALSLGPSSCQLGFPLPLLFASFILGEEWVYLKHGKEKII